MSPLVSKFRALLEPNPDGTPISDQARKLIEQAIAAQELKEAKETLERSEVPVPPITDPMGRHWKQPDPNGMVFDATHVAMSQADFDALLDYSASIPSGVYPGKMWRCCQCEVWYLRWFGLCETPGFVSNHHREILVIK